MEAFHYVDTPPPTGGPLTTETTEQPTKQIEEDSPEVRAMMKKMAEAREEELKDEMRRQAAEKERQRLLEKANAEYDQIVKEEKRRMNGPIKRKTVLIIILILAILSLLYSLYCMYHKKF